MITKPGVAVALLLFLAAGCGDSTVPVDSPSSPLGAGGDPVEECVPDPSATAMTNGFTVLENHSKGTVVVNHVGFYGDHQLQFIKAVVVPIRYNAIGMTAGWPPRRKRSPSLACNGTSGYQRSGQSSRPARPGAAIATWSSPCGRPLTRASLPGSDCATERTATSTNCARTPSSWS